MRHIIDLCDLTEKEFSDLYKLVSNIIDRPEGYVDACRGKVLGSLFYEPSTRTNLSFSTAMMRLGGSVVGFSDPNATSASKGETLKDTINMVSSYADMIVMRNPREGAAKVASMYSSVPVIAQACAVAAANEPDWATETAKRIAEERRFLSDGLAAHGLTVFPGEANFLLFRSNDTGLHEKLAEHGIMIRNCDNYRGLSAGYYRVAVKTREASKCLLNAIKLIMENG